MTGICPCIINIKLSALAETIFSRICKYFNQHTFTRKKNLFEICVTYDAYHTKLWFLTALYNKIIIYLKTSHKKEAHAQTTWLI